MPITSFDGLFVAIVLVSAVLAMVRGFVREIISIIPWILAALAAYRFHDVLVPYLQDYLSSNLIAIVASVGIIVVVTLLITGLLSRRLSDMILDSRIGPLDRSIGFVFGAARGLLLMVVVAVVFNWFVSGPLQPAWISNSKSKPMLDSIGNRLIVLLPDPTQDRILNNSRSDGRSNQTIADELEEQSDSNTYSDADRNRLDQLSTSSNN